MQRIARYLRFFDFHPGIVPVERRLVRPNTIYPFERCASQSIRLCFSESYNLQVLLFSIHGVAQMWVLYEKACDEGWGKMSLYVLRKQY